MANVDRPTLVELIEAEKSQLSPEALQLCKELDESHYFSNDADRIINEDFSNEQANTYLRHQDHQIDILKRFEQMREKISASRTCWSRCGWGYASLTRQRAGESRRNRTGTSA